jgi:transmembrane sensor
MSYKQKVMKRRNNDIDLITRYLLKEDNTKEKEMIDKLIKEDEQSRLEFDAYVELWEKSADLKKYDSINSDEDWGKVRARINFEKTGKRIPLLYYGMRVAAVLVIAMGLFWLYTSVFQNPSDQKITYIETLAKNEPKTLELPDGSIIYINKNSKIIHADDFGRNNRDIILQGEAFFEVARNEQMPFRVHMLNSVVEVLGTSFDIKAESGVVVVGVVTGKVAFYENKNTMNRVNLQAHNTGYYDVNTSKISSDDSFDANRIAWHSKEFIFKNMPLQNVCNILADYYSLELITSEDVQFIDSVNIKYSTQSLDELLSRINSFLLEDIEIVPAGDKLIVRKQ